MCCGAKKTTAVWNATENKKRANSSSTLGTFKGTWRKHPVQFILKPCQEKEKRTVHSFGWTIEDQIIEIGFLTSV